MVLLVCCAFFSVIFVVFMQEVAGLTGDANYWKHEVEFQTNKKLFWDTVSFAFSVLHRFPLKCGPSKLQGMKLQDMKMIDQMTAISCFAHNFVIFLSCILMLCHLVSAISCLAFSVLPLLIIAVCSLRCTRKNV